MCDVLQVLFPRDGSKGKQREVEGVSIGIRRAEPDLQMSGIGAKAAKADQLGVDDVNVDWVDTGRQKKVDESYRMGDVRSLIQAHEEIDLEKLIEHKEEAEGAGGEYIKAFVLGGLDGIVSTFALVASMGGAHMALGQLIAVGLAKVIADAFSMGFGEFASATAELEHALGILARETWETENHKDGEVKEMCEIYMQKGCSKEDALTTLSIMSKYKDLFIEHMLVMEHGILPPDADDKWQPLKQGLVCFLAFAAFGMIPLAGFIVVYMVGGNSASGDSSDLSATMGLAYALTAATLFFMGVAKAKLTGQSTPVRSGIMMLVNGTVAGGVAYLVGETLVAIIV